MTGADTLDLFDAPPESGPSRSRRRLVLAAAGSGKTHRLTSELIHLLARGVPPEEILVSTFTRKAAGEILERVLVRLAAAASDVGEARTLTSAFGDSALHLAPAEYGALLERIARNLHRLQIQTVDAFFYRVARAFALELELPPTWEVPTDPDRERLRARAIDAALLSMDGAVIHELVAQIGEGPAGRSVHDLLLGGVRDLHPTHVALDPGVANPWGFPGGRAAFPPVDPAERGELIARLEVLELPRTGAGAEDANWSKARAQALGALRRGDFEAFASKGVAKVLLEGKTEFARKMIEGPVLELHLGLLRLARMELGAKYQRRVEALGRFLPEYDKKLTEIEWDEGLYHFDDITCALLRARDSDRSAELFYRLDGQVRHLLLDEFQDTSNAQWSALEPLVGEILSGYEDERVAFIVADPKQSIFGWRGGEPRLIEHLEKTYALPVETLTLSRRSSPVVLGAVNRVFGGLDGVELLREYAEEVRGWTRAFHKHSPERDRPGYVRLETGPEDESESRRDVKPGLLAYAAERARDLRAAAPSASLAILTRTNASAASLMESLRALGVDASEEGGVPVTDSAPVLAVLAALKFADHPGDKISGYLAATTPLGALLGLTNDGWRSEARMADLAREIRTRLLSVGYGAVLSEWCRALLPALTSRDQRRLRQLVELGFRWDERSTLRPSDFVSFASSARAEDPTSAAVRVMTIHRAKGLEFDAVLLPDLDALSLVQGPDSPFLPYREGGTGPVKRVYPRVERELVGLFPELEVPQAQARESSLRDALSTLYVGMTRARHATYLIVAPDREGKSAARSAARLVRETLAPGAGAEPLSILWEDGKADWWKGAEPERRRRAPTARGASRGPGPALTFAPTPRRRFMHTRTPSGQLAESGGVDRLLDLTAAAANDRGAVVHRWLEMIEWIEDGVPPDREMLAAATERAPLLGRPAELLGSFREWIEAPAIRRLLSRDAFPSGTGVGREQPFLVREKDVLVEGRVDRVLRMNEVDGPNGPTLLIVDWKTDALDPGDTESVDRRAAAYEPQIQAYRRALSAAERVPLSRVTGCIAFLTAGLMRQFADTP